jgi:hypothetical protein
MPDGAKNWCFTWNNYTPGVEQHLQGLDDGVSYLIYGREIGESGTPHLQGFIQFPTRRSLAATKRILGGNPHLEVARNVPAAVEYCKKDGDIFEKGTLGTSSGRRSDLDEFKKAIKSHAEPLTMADIRELFSDVYARYPRFCIEYYRDHAPKREVEAHPLREWQRQLNIELNLAPDDRTIHFIVDRRGNGGKTWFAQYYASLHDNVQILQPGKHADMAYALETNVRVLFLDVPRARLDIGIPYATLEQIKNGQVFSGKYESFTKHFQRVHVVVMMNEMPDMQKLSIDRYAIAEI